eukprot:CAMPEP_0197310106 /NCGR_PEP_ID=MMETSP0891-20130614/8727_1 /TAXON_ID=44058 ORGANISM="Aureoumbra lagunensis, Strain CCMP1510" /NCGR_SAMPLE_ID=MMETSP0891 /ASSEMBLY_ACC=CAM_ASM_000534 /LENGTH=430 /DNA_ID=CAMNT_0042795589 /DNA_START=798 /DNA_END=2090 /DNA_ORIENTATION=-
MAAARRRLKNTITKEVLPQTLERTAWRSPIRLPIALEEKRAKYLTRRTGPQLKRMIQKYFSRTDKEIEQRMNQVDDSLLRAWIHLSPHYAILRRVLSEKCILNAKHKIQAGKVLTVGDGTAALGALRDLLGSETKINCVEGTTARVELTNDLCGDKLTFISQSLADVARLNNTKSCFALIVCAFHLSEVRDTASRDATLAVLWGCLAPEGILIIVESDQHEHFVQSARARLLNPYSHKNKEDMATILAPCPMDGQCPLLKKNDEESINDSKRNKCVFGQIAVHPNTGPALRSHRSRDAGRVDTRRSTIERFSYIIVQKGRCTISEPPSARVVATPLKKIGHVIVDMCTANGVLSRVTIPRAATKRQSKFSFSLARSITWGSKLTFSPSDSVLLTPFNRSDDIDDIDDIDEIEDDDDEEERSSSNVEREIM